MSQTRIYNIWQSMMRRTTNPADSAYPYYGGRGIKVCDRWRSLENFLTDMGPTYVDGLSIDRIDVNGHYEPGNCRWATDAEQARNKRNSAWIEFRGHRLCEAEWAERLGINPKTLASRFRYGWPVERALTEGVSPERLAAL